MTPALDCANLAEKPFSQKEWRSCRNPCFVCNVRKSDNCWRSIYRYDVIPSFTSSRVNPYTQPAIQLTGEKIANTKKPQPIWSGFHVLNKIALIAEPILKALLGNKFRYAIWKYQAHCQDLIHTLPKDCQQSAKS